MKSIYVIKSTTVALSPQTCPLCRSYTFTKHVTGAQRALHNNIIHSSP